MSFPGWEMQLLVFWDNQLVFYKACTISFLCLSIHLCIYCYRYCLHFHTEEAIRVLSPHEEIQFQCRKKQLTVKCDILHQVQSTAPRTILPQQHRLGIDCLKSSFAKRKKPKTKKQTTNKQTYQLGGTQSITNWAWASGASQLCVVIRSG